MKQAINYAGGYTATSLIDYLKGSTLETAVCWKLTPKVPLRGPKKVTWQNVAALAAADNGLACAPAGSDGWGTRGASSVETFTDEGGVGFRRGAPTSRFMCGLSSDDASQHYDDIDFAWYVDTPGGLAQVYESGGQKLVIPVPPETAVYSIKRLWDYTLNRYKIVYCVDDEIKYTSLSTPSATLRVDVAFSGLVAGALADVCLTQQITAVGATSHTQDLALPGHPGIVFRSSLGGVPSTIDTEAGHESAGLTVESVFDDAAVTQEGLEAGDFYGAKVEVFTVNVRALDMGQLVEFAGRVGRVETEGEAFSAEARPLTSVAQAQVGRRATAKCDVRHFADKFLENRCKLDPGATLLDGGPITVTGTVTAASDNTEFVDAARTQGADYFTMGEVTFTSGPLAGRTFEVREWDAANKKFVLRRGAPVRIGVGWAYSAKRGCPRTPAFCRDVAGNIINIRAETFITNVEAVNRIKRAT